MSIKPILFRLLIYGFVVFLFSSCGPTPIFEQKIICPSEWNYQDTLRFSYEVKDTNIAYSMYLTIDHAKTFGFENIYFKILTHFPDGHSIQNVVSMDLMDKSGLWLGKCNDINCSLSIPISLNAYFKQKGMHDMQLIQHSRLEKLLGVHSLELLIIPVDK